MNYRKKQKEARVYFLGELSMLLKNRSSGKEASWRVSTVSFVVLLAYTLFIWWQEALDLLMWTLHMQQATIASRIVAFILCAVMMAYVGRFERKKFGFSPVYIIGSLFIFVFFVIKGIAPDQSYDTQNYHLLSQIPGFTDNLHYHVIPGRFQMFGFRLGDRMFYPFRLILGLRMGTILNAFAMLVIYRQLTVFFDMATYSKTTKTAILKHFSPILAFLVVSRVELIQESGSYMVELLAIPFLLEMVFIFLRDVNEDKIEHESIMFCLFGGILFCLKMTNIVYLVPLVLLYLWKIRKYLNPKLFFICLFMGAFPVGIYLIYNGISMKNPVYPYYNSLIRSPYYPETDFKDARWGPIDIKELLLWPYMMIRYPEYRLSELPDKHNFDIALMYIGAVIAGIVWCNKKIRLHYSHIKEEVKTEQVKTCVEGKLFLLYAASFILWAATTGHSRYFMGGLLFAGMFCGCLVIRSMIVVISGQGYLMKKASGGLFVLLFIAVYISRTFDSYSAVYNGREWAMRVVNRENISKNLPYVFKDHQLFTEEELSKIDYIFLTWADVGSYARLAGENVPVWNRYSVVNELAEQKDAYIDEIETAMEDGKGVYDMFQQGIETLVGYLAWMNDAGWYVNDLEYQETILNSSQAFTLAGIEMPHGRENRWFYTQNIDGNAFGTEQNNWIWEYTEENEHPVLKMILCDPDYWTIKYPFDVSIIASDGTNTKTAAVITAGDKEYEALTVQLDLTGLSGNIKLEPVSTVEGKRAVVINPEWIDAD